MTQNIITGSWGSEDEGFSVLVHGGAGNVPAAARAEHEAGCRRAAEAGANVLLRGGSALDAVEAAVKVLEDDPVFNAGTGACLNAAGHLELDASIMGGDLSAGAVCALPSFKNPIAIARAVLAADGHVLYAGAGAEAFALDHGFARTPEEEMVSEAARTRLSVVRAGATDNWAGGTVGAVARDRQGRVAAATSTGGKVNKGVGRVGDSPILGAGTYADDRVGACSNTGDGETFMKVVLAKIAIDSMATGLSPEAAARRGLEILSERTNGEGGTILVDHKGRLGWARTTTTMSWAAFSERTGQVRSGV